MADSFHSYEDEGVLWNPRGSVKNPGPFKYEKESEKIFGKGRCQFLLYQYSTSGLGNRIQGLVSSFAYALLTGRVLLMGDWQMAELICNPFPESQWFLPWKVYDLAQKMSRSTSVKDLMREAEGGGKGVNHRGAVITRARVDLSYLWNLTDQNFFCDRIQQQLGSVMWVTLNTEQYFIPGLFVIPAFKETLEALFPDRAPFTYLSRHILHPVNYLWERITRMHSLHFKPSHERIGVQIRTFASNDSYAFGRILSCLSDISHAVPKAISPEEWRDTMRWGKGFMGSEGNVVEEVVEHPQPRRVTLFLTSLYREAASYFTSLFTEGVASDGSLVDVFSYSSEGEQREDLLQDERALVEIFLLSFCDKLFTTHFSTFGYVAAGLSGKAPYLMNIISSGAATFAIPFELNGRPVCEVSHSSEPCSIFPPHERQCQKGGGNADRHMAQDAPYFRQCHDEALGVRLAREA